MKTLKMTSNKVHLGTLETSFGIRAVKTNKECPVGTVTAQLDTAPPEAGFDELLENGRYSSCEPAIKFRRTGLSPDFDQPRDLESSSFLEFSDWTAAGAWNAGKKMSA